MKNAFIFTGQGNQYLGMGKDLYEGSKYAKNIIDSLDLGYDFKKICVEENEQINNTLYAQSAIVLISVLLAKLLEEKGVIPHSLAGLSLGEYSALCVSKVIDLKECIEIVKKRASIMSQTLENSDSSMAAIMSYDKAKIEENIKDCQIANYNSYNQIVITGKDKDIQNNIDYFTADGAKCIKLNVSGAFHSKLLENANELLKEELLKHKYEDETVPIYYNYTGKTKDRDYIELLTKQLYNPVQFITTIENMLNDGIENFYVIGVGNAPRMFIKNIADKNGKKVKIKCIQYLKDIEEI